MDVYSIEIIPELEASAKALLTRLEYENIQTRNVDGYFGWEEEAPFDAVIVTAAPDHLPQPLIQQLADGGKMVVPIGPTGAVQTLWLFEKEGEDLIANNLGAVSFVPLTGEH
jgi:protein-L-isoaspartate(D-aspartate) O-methyltransferase